MAHKAVDTPKVIIVLLVIDPGYRRLPQSKNNNVK